jgi:hypothetical protein
MRAFFMVWSATNDRGDLSQIADPDTLSKTAKQENQMEKLNCCAGDLAIAIKAHNPSNIGSIVKVLRKHPNQYIIPDEIGQFIWMVEGSHLLTYTKGGRTYRQKRGAVPDSYLKPIKGQPSNDQLVTGQPHQIEDKPKKKRKKSEPASVSAVEELDQSVKENA